MVRDYSSTATNYFKQIEDIDLYGTEFSTWTPIPTFACNYDGEYEGNIKKISNLLINSPTSDNQAFIATNTGTVSNLIFDNVNVTGQNNVAGLAVYNTGSIIGCSIDTVSVTGADNVAGLVASTSSSINGCSIENATITGANYVGGMVARNNTGSSISNSKVKTATVTSGSNSIGQYFGGFVGYNDGSISLSFANDIKVTNYEYEGGFVGYNDINGNINKCYAREISLCYGGLIDHNLGQVSSCYVYGINGGITTSNRGGIIGYVIGKASNCYIYANPSPNNYTYVDVVVGYGGLLFGKCNATTENYSSNCFGVENKKIHGNGGSTYCWNNINSYSSFHTKWSSGWSDFNASNEVWPPDLKELPRE